MRTSAEALFISLMIYVGSTGSACSVVLIFVGVILLTDIFHIPSELLYRLYLEI